MGDMLMSFRYPISGNLNSGYRNDLAAVSRRATPFQHSPSDLLSLAPLSRGLVQLFRLRAGRGATQAKSFWAGDDALLVLFEGGYTKAEKTLWDQGRLDTAAAYRHITTPM
jgi:hypothetical protein